MSRQGRVQTALRAVVLTVLAVAAFLWGPAGCSKTKPAPRAASSASAPADKATGDTADSPSSRPAPPWVSDAENDFLPAPARYPEGGAPGR